MKRLTPRDLIVYGGAVLVVLSLAQSWDTISAFLGVVFSSVIPLMLGAAIAYVISIPTNFLERHILPGSGSAFVENIRRPLALMIAVVLMVTAIVLASLVFVPAFIETVTMFRDRSQAFIMTLVNTPSMEAFKKPMMDFLSGDLMKNFSKLDIMGMINTAFGGTVGTISSQVFTVVSMVMTGFFGLLFSFILLTDTTDSVNKAIEVVVTFLGEKRAQKLSLVLSVADASFHSFIVRQCLEAATLGSVAAFVLLATGYEYALGVGVLMGLAALVPIVGYPVGLLAGAFMVVLSNPLVALLYLICVAVVQVLEATFVLPHVGDRKTVLPPVWTAVGVTIGGGVAGFVGMLVAIPTAATLRQLVLIEANRRRQAEEEVAEVAEGEEKDSPSALDEGGQDA